MTQKIAFLLLSLALLSQACKKNDPALVTELQGHVNSFSQVNADLQKSTGEIREIQRLFSDPGIAKGDTTELHNLRERLQMISNRVTVRLVEYGDILKKLQQLSTEYQAGKLTAEEVRREITLFGDRLKGAPDFSKGVTQGLSEIKTKFLQLTGDRQIQ